MKERYGFLTNDVETTSIWHNALRDDTGRKVLKEGMPLLLDLYSKYDIRSTFFVTGYLAALYPEIVKMIQASGHEVACHGLVHDADKAFDIMSPKEQLQHLVKSKKILEDISGEEVVSFRAPALRVNEYTPKALIEAGFCIDSSTAPQRFDFFLSYGGLKKLRWLISPRLPYYTSEKSLLKKGDSEILEVPLNSFFISYIGTTMRMFPVLAALMRRLVHLEYKIHDKPLNFLFHPNEIIDESDEVIDKIGKRTNNYLKYLLAEKLRRNLKIKNLGAPGFELYKNQVDYFIKKEYRFITIKEYKKIYDAEK